MMQFEAKTELIWTFRQKFIGSDDNSLTAQNEQNLGHEFPGHKFIIFGIYLSTAIKGMFYFRIYLARALSDLEIPYQVLNENFKTHKMKTSERKSGEYKTGCCHFLEMISMLTV